MSVKLMQTETTYEVEYKDREYIVTILCDEITFGYTQYDVYCEGELVEDNLEEEVINYLEENIP